MNQRLFLLTLIFPVYVHQAAGQSAVDLNSCRFIYNSAHQANLICPRVRGSWTNRCDASFTVGQECKDDGKTFRASIYSLYQAIALSTYGNYDKVHYPHFPISGLLRVKADLKRLTGNQATLHNEAATLMRSYLPGYCGTIIDFMSKDLQLTTDAWSTLKSKGPAFSKSTIEEPLKQLIINRNDLRKKIWPLKVGDPKIDPSFNIPDFSPRLDYGSSMWVRDSEVEGFEYLPFASLRDPFLISGPETSFIRPEHVSFDPQYPAMFKSLFIPSTTYMYAESAMLISDVCTDQEFNTLVSVVDQDHQVTESIYSAYETARTGKQPDSFLENFKLEIGKDEKLSPDCKKFQIEMQTDLVTAQDQLADSQRLTYKGRRVSQYSGSMQSTIDLLQKRTEYLGDYCIRPLALRQTLEQLRALLANQRDLEVR